MTRKKQQKSSLEIPADQHLKDNWGILVTLIQQYGDVCRAHEMRGGGDPLDIPLIEKECELAIEKVNNHINKLKRDLE